MTTVTIAAYGSLLANSVATPSAMAAASPSHFQFMSVAPQVRPAQLLAPLQVSLQRLGALDGRGRAVQLAAVMAPPDLGHGGLQARVLLLDGLYVGAVPVDADRAVPVLVDGHASSVC